MWLIVAPFALRPASPAIAWTVNDIGVGILLVVFCWWMLTHMAPTTAVPIVELLCGIWLLLAPYLPRHQAVTPAKANDILCGTIAIGFAVMTARTLTRTSRTV
jgi:hypothetical protein